MELIQLSDTIFYTYLRVGNNKNGNAIYSINIFEKFPSNNIVNITFEKACRNKIKCDKFGGVKKVCYKHEIESIVKELMEV